jgi:hypothetical protein
MSMSMSISMSPSHITYEYEYEPERGLGLQMTDDETSDYSVINTERVCEGCFHLSASAALRGLDIG